MNRELQQVRRYWPKARYAGWNWHGWQSEDEPGVLYMRYSSERRRWRKRYELCLDEEQDGWRVTGSNQDQICRGATIPEAMRAAGFGVRPLGEYASRLKSSRTVVYKRGTYVVIATVDWQPMCVDRQRPRKGARLGRLKMEVRDEP